MNYFSIFLLSILLFFTLACDDFNEEGLQAFNNGDYEEAEAYFSKAVEYEPNSPSLKFNLAKSQEKLGDFKSAYTNYNEALEWDERLLDANLGRARCSFEMENYKRSANDIKYYLSFRPEDVEALLLDAKVQMKLGEFWVAYAQAKKAYKIDNENINAVYLLAVINGRLGFLNRAEYLFKKSIQLSPDRHEIYYGMGNIMFMRNRFSEALAYYKQAESKGMSSIELQIQRGLAHLNMNKTEAACKVFSAIKDATIRAYHLNKYCR